MTVRTTAWGSEPEFYNDRHREIVTRFDHEYLLSRPRNQDHQDIADLLDIIDSLLLSLQTARLALTLKERRHDGDITEENKEATSGAD